MPYSEIAEYRVCLKCGKMFKRTNEHKFVCPRCNPRKKRLKNWKG